MKIMQAQHIGICNIIQPKIITVCMILVYINKLEILQFFLSRTTKFHLSKYIRMIGLSDKNSINRIYHSNKCQITIKFHSYQMKFVSARNIFIYEIYIFEIYGVYIVINSRKRKISSFKNVRINIKMQAVHCSFFFQ